MLPFRQLFSFDDVNFQIENGNICFYWTVKEAVDDLKYRLLILVFVGQLPANVFECAPWDP